MTLARLTLVNTRTIRGLALVPDTLDGRRSQHRTDTCLDHCDTDQGSSCVTSHSAADEAGRGLGIRPSLCEQQAVSPAHSDIRFCTDPDARRDPPWHG